jgi:hypothetical protein
MKKTISKSVRHDSGITFIRYTQNEKIGKPGITFIRYTQNEKIGKSGITFIRYAQNRQIGKPNNLCLCEHEDQMI